MKSTINIKGKEIVVISKNNNDYISMTDIAKHKDQNRSDYIVQNWLRNRNTIEFLGIWEKINNPNFNPIEFEGFRSQAGLNSFILTPKQWIEKTNSIGIISSPGRYGGTYAHRDIAFEFASWISVEFRLYLIKEFQRLKFEESERLKIGWNVKRELVKINYKIHTDAIKENLIPHEISPKDAKIIYASEADVLNKALFGMTAKEWKDRNPEKEGNLRDYTNVTQLVVLANLEALNSEFIKDGIVQGERLVKLNQIAIYQIRSLIDNKSVKKIAERADEKKGD